MTRRAPVQRDCQLRPVGRYGCPHTAESPKHNHGSITWAEHEEAWADYAKRYGRDQDAETIATRGGFGYSELVDHLGHPPRTWEPRG
jgi:hypothetical protein